MDGWTEDMTDWIGLMNKAQDRDRRQDGWIDGLMAQRDHLTRNESSTMHSHFSLSPTFLIMLFKKISSSFSLVS